MNLPEVELADVGPAWKCNKMIVKIKKHGYEINVRKSRRRVNLSTIQQNKTKHWGHWALLLQYIISRIVPVLCSGYSSPECNDSCFSTSRQISALIIVCVCVCELDNVYNWVFNNQTSQQLPTTDSAIQVASGYVVQATWMLRTFWATLSVFWQVCGRNCQ